MGQFQDSLRIAQRSVAAVNVDGFEGGQPEQLYSQPNQDTVNALISSYLGTVDLTPYITPLVNSALANGNYLKGSTTGTTTTITDANGNVVSSTTSTGSGVSSINGTANQLVTNSSIGDVTISIPNNPLLPGVVSAIGFAPGGFAGATQPTRFMGGTVSAAPTTGTWTQGDYVIGITNGTLWVCTASGTPGTWANTGTSSGVTGLATSVVSETSYGQSAAVGVGTLSARSDHTHGSPATPVTSAAAGTGISVSGSTGPVTFTNTGVTSLVVTNNASVSASTGSVTITNSLTPTFYNATSSQTNPNWAMNDGSYTGRIALASANGNWYTNVLAGDVVIRGDAAGNTQGVVLAAGPTSTGYLRLTNAGTTMGGTLNTSGNLSENGNRVYTVVNQPPYPVTSVATRTGAVTLTGADIGSGLIPGNLTVNNSSTGTTGTSIPGIIWVSATDNFLLHGVSVPHYGLAGYAWNDGNGTTGTNMSLSGFFGLSFSTQGTERFRINNNGAMTLAGATTLTSTVSVTGPTTLNSTLSVVGNVTAPDVALTNVVRGTPGTMSLLHPAFGGRQWNDRMRFNAPSTVEVASTITSPTWTTTGAPTPAQFLVVMAGRTDAGTVNMTTALPAMRATWNSSSNSWSQLQQMMLAFGYNTPTSSNINAIWETSTDGVTWTSRTNVNFNVDASWVTFALADNGGDNWLRLSLLCTMPASATTSLRMVSIYSSRPGDQGGGEQNNVPYSWGGDKAVSFPAAVTVSGATTLNNGASINGAVTASSTVTISGVTTVNSTTYLNGTVTVSSGVSLLVGRSYLNQNEMFIDRSGNNTDRWRFTASGGTNYLQTDGTLVVSLPFTGTVRFSVDINGNTLSAGSSTASQFQTNTSGNTVGAVNLIPGDNAHSGYIEFRAVSGVRQGYIGYSSTNVAQDTGTLLYNTGTHQFNGSVTVSSNLSTNAITVDPLVGSANAMVNLTGRNSGVGATAQIWADWNGGIVLNAAAGQSVRVQSPSAGTAIALVVKGYSGQSIDLQQWQNSSGAMLARVDQAGNYVTTARVLAGGTAAPGQVSVNITASSTIGIGVRAFSGQSANLQSWMDSSGNTMSAVTNVGDLVSPNYFTYTAGGTLGQIALRAGNTTNSGFAEFYSAAGIRQGYIGYSSSTAAQDAGILPYNAGTHQFIGNVTTTANLTINNGKQVYYNGIGTAIGVLGSDIRFDTITGGAGAGAGNLASQTVYAYNIKDGAVTSAKLSAAALATYNIPNGTAQNGRYGLLRYIGSANGNQDSAGQDLTWYLNPGTGLTRVTDGAAYGGYAAKATAGTAADTVTITYGPYYGSGAGPELPGLAPGTYRYTAFLKVSSTAPTALAFGLAVNCNTSGVVQNNSTYTDFNASDSSTSYIGHSIVFTILADSAGSAGLEFYVRYRSAANVDVSVSHFQVTPYDPRSQGEITTTFIRDAAITNAKVSDLSVTKLTAGTINTDDIYLGVAGHIYAGNKTGGRVELNAAGLQAYQTVNLLPAAAQSFEDGTTGGWSAQGSATLTNSTAQAWIGTKSLSVVTAGGAAYQGAFTPNVTYTAGVQYTFSVNVRPTTTVTLRITADGSSDGFRGAGGDAGSTCPANVWTRLSITFVPTATGAKAHYIDTGTTTQACTYYLDGAQSEVGSSVTTFTTNTSASATNFTLANNGILTATNPSGARIILDPHYGLDFYDTSSVSKMHLDMATGSATFAGALSAATGTFAGSLSAATGSFGGSLSAATGTFAGSLSAATGTFTGSLSAATGTFAGSLSAATGSFTGTLSVGTSPNWFQVDSSGNIWSGAATFGSAPFRVANTGALTATSATITGSITSTSGTIGGFSLSSTSLSAGSGATSVILDTANGIALGGTGGSGGNAPFRVLQSGALTATSATISGAVTVTSGSITINSGANEFAVDTSGNMWVGASTYGSAPFRVSNAGALVATNANISGTITSSAGNIGGWSIGASTLQSTGGNIQLVSGTNPYIYLNTTTANLLLDTRTGNNIFAVYKVGTGNTFTADVNGNITLVGTVTTGALTVTGLAGNFQVGGTSGFIVDTSGNHWAGATTLAAAPFSVTVGGLLKATSGSVGGWTLGTTTLTGTNVTLDSAGTVKVGTGSAIVSMQQGVGLWAGNAAFGSASFRVDTSGNLTTAGTVTLGGTLSVTGTTTLNATLALGTGTISSTNFNVTSAGVVTATSATITGVITATSGAFTGDVQISTGSLYAGASPTSGQRLRVTSSGITAFNSGGTQTFTVDTAGNLTTTAGTVSLGGTLTVAGNTTLNATLTLGSGTIASTNFNVTNTGVVTATGATINGQTSLNGTLVLGGTLYTPNGNVGNGSTAGVTLSTAGLKGFSASSATPVTVIDATNGTLSTSNATLSGTLTVGAATTLNGTLTLGTGQISSTNFNVTSAGVMTATGATITGTTSLNGTLVLGGTLYTPNANVGNGTTAGVTLSTAGLKAYSNSSSTPITTIDATTGAITASSATFSGTLTVGATTTLNGTLTLGTGSISSTNFTVSSAGVVNATSATLNSVTIQSTSTLNGTVTVGATLTVSGTIQSSTTVGTSGSGYRLSTTGLEFYNATTRNFFVDMSGNVTSSGTTTLGGSLNVTGTTSLQNTLTLSTSGQIAVGSAANKSVIDTSGDVWYGAYMPRGPRQTAANVTMTTATTGGTLAAGLYKYWVQAVNADGTPGPVTVAVGAITTTGTTSTVTVSWNNVLAGSSQGYDTRAITYTVYRQASPYTGLSYYQVASGLASSAASVVDTGSSSTTFSTIPIEATKAGLYFAGAGANDITLNNNINLNGQVVLGGTLGSITTGSTVGTSVIRNDGATWFGATKPLGIIQYATAVTGTPSTTGGSIPAGSYRYIVVGINSNGTFGLIGTSGLVTTTGSTSSVVVNWTNNYFDNTYNEYESPTSIRVYRALASGGHNYYVGSAASITTATFTDTTGGTGAGGTWQDAFPTSSAGFYWDGNNTRKVTINAPMVASSIQTSAMSINGQTAMSTPGTYQVMQAGTFTITFASGLATGTITFPSAFSGTPAAVVLTATPITGNTSVTINVGTVSATTFTYRAQQQATGSTYNGSVTGHYIAMGD